MSQTKENSVTPLATIDGETLMAATLPPIRFVVDNILPQGLHLLAGSPKIGKSWLVLKLCLQVATGAPMWSYQTHRGDVLYLCLEDSLQRIQHRLFLLSDEAPDNLHFATLSLGLEDGLLPQIEAFIAAHPATVLIAIDTLQRVRNTLDMGSAYANDYRDIGRLKTIADKYSIAILLVHHLRKLGDNDPLNMVSGTTGLTGAVDTNLVLCKDSRAGTQAKLTIVGRDVEQKTLMLSFDKQAHNWDLLSCEDADEIAEPVVPPVLSSVCGFMRGRECWTGSSTELLSVMDNTSVSPIALTKLLNQHRAWLAAQGVGYEYHREPQCRVIRLTSIHDGCDGYDG